MAKSLSYRSGAVVANFIGAVEDEWQLYSDNPDNYTIGPTIGFGASSTVYIATFKSSKKDASPTPIQCALKVVDLDSMALKSLQLLKRETQLMSLSKHPNVLRVRGTWMNGHKLYIAMRLMKSGSVADVMRYGFPGGLEEEVCRTILKQALEGLNYLHTNGFIHRDLKAANFLIDEDGTVLLGDLGVAVALSDEEGPLSTPDKKTINPDSGKVVERSTTPAGRTALQVGKRRSFVGTPCWMAPEVISQHQYDSKADIWSFAITALELTQGRAPRFREPPHKVLLKTLNDKPPALDRTGGPFTYSAAFQEVVEICLVKDPSKRPTATDLLKRPFFRNTKKKSYLVATLLKGLPPLVDRQERKKQASGPGPQTMDSWDFTTTMTNLSTTTQQQWSLDPCITPVEETSERQSTNHLIPPEEEQELSRVSSNSSKSDSSTPQTPPDTSGFQSRGTQGPGAGSSSASSGSGGTWRKVSTQKSQESARTFGLSSASRALKERFDTAFDRTNNRS